MTSAVQQRRGSYIDRPSPSSLADVVELILDKGLVIDAYVRVSLVGIELLTIDARIVIASVDTYLRFAEATNRLDLYEHGGKGLTELGQSLSESGAKGKTRGALNGAKEKVDEMLHGSDDDDDDDSGNGGPRRRPRARQGAARRRPRREDDDE
jgi:gas vesicle structural protein